ncbi:Ldb19 protein [Martiniozyma asiatica (nom. inval.)]|nr:Ldb19 protein [Martiniozyma asiatica]
MPSFTKLFSGIKPQPESTTLSPVTSASGTPCPFHMQINLETPPIVIFGSPTQSSGAFFSGNLYLTIPSLHAEQLQPQISISKLAKNIQHHYMILNDVSIKLVQIINIARPFQNPNTNDCKKCDKREKTISDWPLLSKKLAFAKGTQHSYPFSCVIPGNLPPSSSLCHDGYIKYELRTKCTYINLKGKESTVNMDMPIVIKRSIMRGHDRNSLRIFPPTDVTASAVIPNVVYPRSNFPIEIRLDHLVSGTHRWKMRKLNWRLEESIILKSDHCDRHQGEWRRGKSDLMKKKLKIKKNSGGLGKDVVNYYFELPNKIVKAIEAQQEEDRIANANNHDNNPEIARDAPVEVEGNQTNAAPNSMGLNPVQTNEIGPLGSNWSLSPNGQTIDSIVKPTGDLNSNELFVERIHTLSQGELKSGWKSDFSGNGRIELNVDIDLNNLISTGFNNPTLSSISSSNYKGILFDKDAYVASNNECNCSIDIQSDDVWVFHNLILEVVIAEEVIATSSSVVAPKKKNRPIHPLDTTNPSVSSSAMASNNNSIDNDLTAPPDDRPRAYLSASDFRDDMVGPDHTSGNPNRPENTTAGIPTGTARVLRMQFKVVLTERGGLGMAWDDEVPPTYNKVSALSPPAYDGVKNSGNDDVLAFDNIKI